jgi:hypothetical protein
LKQYLEAVTTIRDQDLERTKEGSVQIRQGVAPDRRISMQDPEMRHGRKSRSKRFDGFKEHIALDLDAGAILACEVTLANRPEEEAAAPLAEDIARQRLTLDELHIDRAYVNSPVVASVMSAGGTVFAKPWAQRAAKPGLFSKADFHIDPRAKTITCPAGEVERFEPGETVHFEGAVADSRWEEREGPTGLDVAFRSFVARDGERGGGPRLRGADRRHVRGLRGRPLRDDGAPDRGARRHRQLAAEEVGAAVGSGATPTAPA